MRTRCQVLLACLVSLSHLSGLVQAFRCFNRYIQAQQRNAKHFNLYMSSNGNDDRSLLEQMRQALGEKEDVFADAEKESKQLLQGLRDLDRDPNMRKNNRFIEWLDENGVWVKQESAWGRAPHPLVISSQTEDNGETCGRGLLSRESLTDGELLMTIPLDLCLSRAVAQETFGKSIIPDYLDEYIAVAILLMSERKKGAESRWKPYFDILPDVEEVYPAFIWSEEELQMLAGSPTFYAAKSLRTKLEKEFLDLQTGTFARNPALFPKDKFTLELFLWSFVMLFSRAARLTSKTGGEELALVPYADLMNHNPYSNTYIDAQRSGVPFISKKEEVAVYTDRSYKKFEQVFINYGEKSNADLLLLYGFALERNPFNAVEITVGLSKEDPMYNSKQAFLERSGRGATSVRFPLQGNRYPSELVDFLRLLLVEAEDIGMQTLDRVDFNEPISPSLERRVLKTIVTICESYLGQYPTSLDEDEILVGDKNLFSALSRTQRMAVKLRASEKRILYRTILAVKEELSKLPEVVSTGEDIIPAGRSFDALRNAPTVANAKSASDWVDMKGMQKKDSASSEASSVAGAAKNTADAGEASSIVERRRRRRSGEK